MFPIPILSLLHESIQLSTQFEPSPWKYRIGINFNLEIFCCLHSWVKNNNIKFSLDSIFLIFIIHLKDDQKWGNNRWWPSFKIYTFRNFFFNKNLLKQETTSLRIYSVVATTRIRKAIINDEYPSKCTILEDFFIKSFQTKSLTIYSVTFFSIENLPKVNQSHKNPEILAT